MSRESSNSILAESPQMPHHTDVGRVFDAMGGLQRRYNWLLSGGAELFDVDHPTWLSGDELTGRVEGGWSQFEWGVFSGFEPKEVVALDGDRFPYADGNRDLWRPYPRPQHRQAVVEIVCWDGSLTLMLSRDPELTRRFRAYFADARDLDPYIDEHVRPILEAWADAARRLPPGAVVAARVAHVGQTTASLELAPQVHVRVTVKQLRAAGFGPRRWFALDDHLARGNESTSALSPSMLTRRPRTSSTCRSRHDPGT